MPNHIQEQRRAKESRLTHERLTELLHYDPDNAVISTGSRNSIWAPQPSKRGLHMRNPDVPAGGVSKQGYRMVTISGVKYYAHRLAWFYVTGEWPADMDHANQNKLDNRWQNLRQATRAP